MLVEQLEDEDTGEVEVRGRAGQQGPDVDGETLLSIDGELPAIGDIVRARVVDTIGIDLVAEPIR